MTRAKKSLGQNFLTDNRVASRIVELVSPLSTDIVIEIGPGKGALTRNLVGYAGWVVAVEIDDRLAGELSRSLKAKNLSVTTADALKVNWETLLDNAAGQLRSLHPQDSVLLRMRVVANLPYYISTPIIENLLSLGHRLFDMTLMLQKEVADRITGGPGTKDYGYLSVLVQYYCIPSRLFDVPASAFSPVPKVTSTVIRLTVRERPAVDVPSPLKFFSLVKAAFAQRRKTILNNLKAAAPSLKFVQPLEVALEAASVAPGRRAETLSVDEFAALYRALGV